MQAQNRHIALLILGGFLFPQVAGSMHYFVVSHNFSAEKDNSFSAPEPDSLFHACVYHFTGFSSGILAPNIPALLQNFAPAEILIFGGRKGSSGREDFNFLLRGPPWSPIIFEINWS